MGYDKLFFFIGKNFTNKCYDTIYPQKETKGYIITKNLFFDINYIIYKCIYDIENDINNIIKNIISTNEKEILINNIKNIFDNNKYLQNIDFSFNYDEFINNVNYKINDLIYIKIFDYMYNTIESIYMSKYIENIHIFFDGIPSYSKILEQRKRRIKNYLTSQYKKKYFSTIGDYEYFDKEFNIYYNYKKFINKSFTIDKNHGPKCKFLLNLGMYLKLKLSEHYPNIYIYDGLEYGEADFKILKELPKYNDVYIHSCDSDFLYFIILYYLKYNNNYTFIKSNKNDSYDIFKSKNIVNLIIDKYKTINNIKNECNINFIYDFLFLIQLFGNDIIPEVFELGVHINIKILFITHYILYKENNFIINLNNNNIINYNNLAKWLSLLNNIELFSIKYLNKYFKLPYNLILLICQDMKYNVNTFINKIVIPYLNGDINIIDNLDIDSKHKEYIKKCFTYIFDKTNVNDYGLYRKINNCEYSDNYYQNYYNFISNNANINIDKILKLDFIEELNPKNAYKEYINITNKTDIFNFFLVLTKQTEILFDINKYESKNIIYCSNIYGPNINSIINYINQNDMSIFFNYKYKFDIYFNKLNHHIFITPYLYNSKFLHYFKNNFIENILNILSYQIDGVIYDDNFKLRDINPIKYIYIINNIINLFEQQFIINLYKNDKYLINFV